jgi:hypothetical protein
MRQISIILGLLFLIFNGCSHKNNSSITHNCQTYFDSLLFMNKKANEFELDTLKGYIKLGHLFNDKKKNAIVVSFDSITSLDVYELRNGNWVKMFTQKNIGFSRVHDIKAYLEDYNFDGKKDIGIKNEVSNGTAIMTFRLWLSKSDTSFIYVPEFENIGNPRILDEKGIVQGFTACCAFSEISLTDYSWSNYKLIKSNILNIDRTFSIHVTQTEYRNDGDSIVTTKKLSKKEIDKLIDDYDGNWKIK